MQNGTLKQDGAVDQQSLQVVMHYRLFLEYLNTDGCQKQLRQDIDGMGQSLRKVITVFIWLEHLGQDLGSRTQARFQLLVTRCQFIGVALNRMQYYADGTLCQFVVVVRQLQNQHVNELSCWYGCHYLVLVLGIFAAKQGFSQRH